MMRTYAVKEPRHVPDPIITRLPYGEELQGMFGLSYTYREKEGEIEGKY